MEVYVFRSVVVSLKDILRENNLLLEDVQSVFVDSDFNYVIQAKAIKCIKED